MHLKYIKLKIFLTVFLTTGLFVIGFWACSKPVGSADTYEVSIKAIENNNIPALQSFAHGVNGSDWLLFAGRTNRTGSFIGGLHNLNANYADSSFIPPSYNDTVYVYNVDSNKLWKKSVQSLIGTLYKLLRVKINKSVFVCSNPLVTQDSDYLYLLGGYGPNPDTSNYGTYNQIVKIHVPSMISLMKGESKDVDRSKLIRIGIDNSKKLIGKSHILINTGGELFKINDTLYMAGGQNFGNSQFNPHPYVNAVYPFTITNSDPYKLNVNIGEPITDVPVDSLGTNFSNSHSTFRRRDVPIVPALYKNGNSTIQGFTFYAGVFKPNTDTLYAWNDAIYVHPGFTNNKLYTYDSIYNQSNNNVYSCADFEAYDSTTGLLHTFLLGGIGTGSSSGPNSLSGFTNNGVHIVMNIDSLKSSYTLINNVFPSDTSHMYGAESDFILNRIGTRNTDPVFYKTSGGTTTEIVDLAKTFANGKKSVLIGYIYGGIEAFQSNPGTYGKGKSAASNKIWQVTLTKK